MSYRRAIGPLSFCPNGWTHDLRRQKSAGSYGGHIGIPTYLSSECVVMCKFDHLPQRIRIDIHDSISAMTMSEMRGQVNASRLTVSTPVYREPQDQPHLLRPTLRPPVPEPSGRAAHRCSSPILHKSPCDQHLC